VQLLGKEMQAQAATVQHKDLVMHCTHYVKVAICNAHLHTTMCGVPGTTTIVGCNCSRNTTPYKHNVPAIAYLLRSIASSCS
jgi:hypothetical protein